MKGTYNYIATSALPVVVRTINLKGTYNGWFADIDEIKVVSTFNLKGTYNLFTKKDLKPHEFN